MYGYMCETTFKYEFENDDEGVTIYNSLHSLYENCSCDSEECTVVKILLNPVDEY